MRHRVNKRHFGRNTNQRKALLRELTRSLVIEGAITTTLPKAKEVQRIADKLVFKAKKNTVPARRKLHQFFGKRDVVNKLVDEVAELMSSRNSGFTKIAVVGQRRGDNALMAELSFVGSVTKGLRAFAESNLSKKNSDASSSKTAKSLTKTVSSKPSEALTPKKNNSKLKKTVVKSKDSKKIQD